MSNSREVTFPSFSSVEPGVVKTPVFAGGFPGCAELSVPLKEVTRNLLKETIRNPVDLGISSDLCKIVVYTDGGAAFRPGESAVASWGFVAVLMCGNEAVCVIGCASGQVVLDRSHPEFLGGTKLTNNVGELQAMCCAVLWLIEQNRIDASMRLEIRFDSKYAAAVAVGTQRCSSNTELVHKLRHHWQCVNENTFGGVGMTHEMADSLAEAAMNGCVVPSSRTELEKWMLSFRGVPVAANWARADMPSRCEEWTSILRKPKNYRCLFLSQKS